MTNDITIRTAVESDEQAIIVIWEELGAYYQSLNPVFPLRWERPNHRRHRIDVLSKLWNDPVHYVGFVATTNDALAGFCRAQITPDGPAGASLHTLVVRPKWRSQGIGRQLMTATISWCKEQGADDVSLDVLPANVSAAKFHQSLGFEPFISSYVKRLR